MEAFYEVSRENSNRVLVNRNTPHAFPPHYHINVEIFILKRGKYTVTCNGKEHQLQAGNIAFFDSYDIHGYGEASEKNCDDAVIVIPSSNFEIFKKFKNKLCVSNPIIFDTDLVDKILNIVDTIITGEKSEPILSSAVNLILAMVQEKLTLSSDVETDFELVRAVLKFIESNYKNDVRLFNISKALGYTREHISRTFHKYLHQSIPDYTNKLRIKYVENGLKNSEKSLVELVYEAGFNCLQTYYRNKRKFKR